MIANYLHQTHSSGSDREWPEESAPGNDLAKILAMRLVPHEGMPPASSTCAGPIGIEIGVQGARARASPLFPKIKVDGRGGRGRVQRDGHRRALARADAAGRVRLDGVDPGNLLNEGSVIVEAAICSIDFPKLEHHAAVYEAISFEVLDPGEGDSARGIFAGQWRGVVRPLLEWTCEEA